MFNALKYTEILETVGFTREQAEQSIKVLIEVMEQNLASSQDFKDLEQRMSTEFKDVRQEFSQQMKNVRQEFSQEIKELDQKMTQQFKDIDQKFSNISHEMKNLEARMTIKLGSLMVLAIGIVSALNKF